MAERGDPQVLKHVVAFLRHRSGKTQEEFGREARMSQSDVSDAELGKVAPADDALQRMARAADVPWHVVLHLIRFLTAVLEAVRRGSRPGPPFDEAVLSTVLLAVLPWLVEEETESGRLRAEELLQEAEEIWAVLEPLPADERRRRIESAPAGACRSWPALVKVACEASALAAADSASKALELADLAFLIAEHVPQEERARAQGYCWGFLGNARRVANNFDGSDEALARAWDVWRSGVVTDSPWFPEWQLLSLEASLRRAQQRFAEALERLGKAQAACGNDRLATGRLLLIKAKVLEHMGDFKGALAVLEEAAPLLAGSKEPRLLAVLQFNRTDNLARLERFEEAAWLLPEVERLAEEQDNGLDRTRVVWLAAKVKAGTGKKEEAMADLGKVVDAFTAEELPYDAALAGLDLAVHWLEAGRTAEVRELAEEMAWIFVSKKITREALASLRLFVEAAKQETATVELARQVIGEVEKARRSRD